MAEAIGTAIGVVGFLGQLFDGCVKAYRYFSTAAHLDGDAQRLLCKVHIEEMRLHVWGREWGVAEGRLEAHLKLEANPQMRQLAIQIMTELYNTVTDFSKLQDKYGLRSQEDSAAAAATGSTTGAPLSETPPSMSPQTSFEGPGVRLGSGAETEAEATGSPKARGHSRRNSKNSNSADKPAGFRWRREVSLRAQWVIAGELLCQLSEPYIPYVAMS